MPVMDFVIRYKLLDPRFICPGLATAADTFEGTLIRKHTFEGFERKASHRLARPINVFNPFTFAAIASVLGRSCTRCCTVATSTSSRTPDIGKSNQAKRTGTNRPCKWPDAKCSPWSTKSGGTASP
jgi:hypothetical protein